MTKVFVLLGLQQLPPSERWARLVGPLADELHRSGLGRILDIDAIRQKANAAGGIDEEELALEFRHVDYGRELVNGFVEAAGLQRLKSAIPKRWRSYCCDDYFNSQFAVNGYWDEAAQQWLIVPAEQVAEDVEAEFLQIGSPGVDGIGFGYRNGQSGLWAYHCMTGQEFQWLASTTHRLLDGWMAGTITV